VEWLNTELASADSLEQMLDASYQVQDVLFPFALSGSSTIFRVDIRCQCAVNTQCCVPERIFVATLLAMKNRADKIVEQVPGDVSELKVVCFNNGLNIAVIGALWQDVKAYLQTESMATSLAREFTEVRYLNRLLDVNVFNHPISNRLASVPMRRNPAVIGPNSETPM
jgi:hypothetical protein